jgi:hypothetical protein
MPKPSPKKPPDSPKLEFEPDACEHFERLVKSAAKMGLKPHEESRPQPKVAVKKKVASKKR